MTKIFLPDRIVDCEGLDRRQLLKVLGAGAVSSFIFGRDLFKGASALAQAEATRHRRFVIYIGCGSWDGQAAGLVQPKDVGQWQHRIFHPDLAKGDKEFSVNPNLNKHFKDGNLVLNGYNKFLQDISEHVCFTAGNARTVSHGDGYWIQSSGDSFNNANCSWVTGIAQTLYDGVEPAAAVIANSGVKLNNATSKVALLNGENIDTFRINSEDPTTIPRGEHADAYWQVLTSLQKESFGVSAVPQQTRDAAGTYINNVIKGIPELAADSPIVTEVLGEINKTRVDELFEQHDIEDRENVKTSTPYTSLLTQLQLAAILAATGKAKGMAIGLDGQDAHEGGSSHYTAWSGSMLWAQLTVFWKWVVKQGLQDQVMVIVSHEFTRSAYEPAGQLAKVAFEGRDVELTSYGTNHWPVFGMVFINGKVPPRSRVGGVGDFFTVFGSDDLTGGANPELVPYSSMDVVGTMLMRCFDDIFYRAREVKNVWPNFGDGPAQLMKILLG